MKRSFIRDLICVHIFFLRWLPTYCEEFVLGGPPHAAALAAAARSAGHATESLDVSVLGVSGLAPDAFGDDGHPPSARQVQLQRDFALLDSSFWGALCLGRLFLTLASPFVSSAWPILYAAWTSCAAGAICLYLPTATQHGNHAILPTGSSGSAAISSGAVGVVVEDPHLQPPIWIAAVLLGLGVATIFPLLMLMPGHYHEELTSGLMATLIASSAIAETICPAAVGVVFKLGRPALFPAAVVAGQIVVFPVLTWAMVGLVATKVGDGVGCRRWCLCALCGAVAEGGEEAEGEGGGEGGGEKAQ